MMQTQISFSSALVKRFLILVCGTVPLDRVQREAEGVTIGVSMVIRLGEKWCNDESTY